MPPAILSDATVSNRVTLHQKIAQSFDYGRVYCEFIDSPYEQNEQEIIKRYLDASETSKYFNSALSSHQYDESLMWAVLDSSVLTDNTSEIIDEALSAAGIYSSFVPSQKQDIELAIANKLKAVEQVIAIYTQRYRSELQVIVFLNTNKYDNELIHKMLDIEYDLQKQFTEPLLAFSYVPNVYENRREVVSKGANLIYGK